MHHPHFGYGAIEDGSMNTNQNMVNCLIENKKEEAVKHGFLFTYH